ncbi:MAG: phage tail sheath family protein [Promethearchaeota archaeon]|nr:MAG: phage tail sheath family protein [Candidatus Lokiarchaeota archaeon]
MSKKFKKVKGIEIGDGSRIKKIEGVSTSNTVFIGLSEKGTLNKPEKITSFEDFQDIFGGFSEDQLLAYNVDGFFKNGGTLCYVIRVENIGIAEIDDALSSLEKIEVNIIAIPDNRGSIEVIKEVIEFCENDGNYFYIIEPPVGLEPDEIINFKDINGLNSSFAALYYPNIYINAPEMEEQFLIQPSGFIAGIYSRTDSRRGVWKAPAGRDVEIIGATGLEIDPSESELGSLNNENINPLRSYQDKVIPWGGKTLEKGTELKYIATKRLIMYIKKSIYKGSQWAIFEPNDEKLWAKLRTLAFDFLTKVWRDGALHGSRPQEAFFVKCDRETNTENVINRGKVRIELGIAISKPAEFTRINIEVFAGKDKK